jgi:predicted dehydrogenase
MTIRVGLVGYGTGGRYFHAPFIAVAAGCELVGVVTRSADRAALVAQELPAARVFESLGQLIDAGVDVVVISTPPETRHELVLEAVQRGIHVVADKPFAPNAAGGEELVRAAADAGVILTVFHNRRWDTDIATLRGVIDSGAVGEIWRLDNRFDLDQPTTLDGGPNGGLLRDLGSHLVDQALSLFGPARYVSAQLDWIDLPAGRTDAGFVISIEHEDGRHSHVSSTKLNYLESRELRLLGSLGSYVSSYSDVQAAASFTGIRPAENRAAWGFEAQERWGTLTTGDGAIRIPSAQGDYTRFYEMLAEAIENNGPSPVPVLEAIGTLRVLDAARRSSLERQTIDLHQDLS